jgi:beta-lactamase regulating signal transducer with metallopeptidase domain
MSDPLMLDVAVRAVGWALLHSVWQGALVATVTWSLLWTLRGSAANVRYVVACLGLAVMVGAWTATAWRSAAVLSLDARAAARAAAGTPAVLLGPAGPMDTSPAIRIISPADLSPAHLEMGRASWQRRVDGWSPVLVPLWLMGVSALSVRLGIAWLLVERLRRRALVPVGAAVAARVAELAGRLRVSRTVRIVQSAAVQVPAVAGWLRPVILLPASVLTGLTPAQFDAVIAHELAHIRRHDFALNILQTAAEILLFYHPASWWISRRIRIEREHCCDDIAVSLCGDRIVYATALADLESMRGDASLALAATDGPLLQRVRRLLSSSPQASRPSNWLAAATPFALVLAVISGATRTNASAAPEPQDAPPAQGRTLPAGYGMMQGQVVDGQSGRPIDGASLEITGTLDATSVRTDETGRFETAPIKTGTYFVSAIATGYVRSFYGQAEGALRGTPIEVRNGRVSSGIDVRLKASGVISGRILDDRGEGLQGVEIVLQPVQGAGGRFQPAFAQTVEGGRYRVSASPGDYYVRAYTEGSIKPTKGDGTQAYASTFYPNARKAEEAQPIRIEPGLEIYDIDFPLATSGKLRVAGTVVDPSGESLETVRVAVRSLGMSSTNRESSVSLDAQGRFEVRDVVPGEYMVLVWDSRRTSRWVGTMRRMTIDEDVDDLELRASNGGSVAGRVVRDPLSTRPLDLTEVRVSVEKQLEGGGLTMTGSLGPVAADGTFALESPGGPVTVSVTSVPEGWTVKSVSLDRVDIAGQFVELGGGATHQLVVVLSDRQSTVAGLVVDRNGRPLGGYAVVLFADDQTRWAPSSPFLMEERSSQTGQFRMKDVPAGDYLAVAVPDLPFRAFTKADVLAQLQSIATRLKVDEGEQKVISIRASPVPASLIP